MSSSILPILAGVAMAATASSAFAFDVMASSPMAMRTHATHQAAVIEVVPANAVIDVNSLLPWMVRGELRRPDGFCPRADPRQRRRSVCRRRQ